MSIWMHMLFIGISIDEMRPGIIRMVIYTVVETQS